MIIKYLLYYQLNVFYYLKVELEIKMLQSKEIAITLK